MEMFIFVEFAQSSFLFFVSLMFLGCSKAGGTCSWRQLEKHHCPYSSGQGLMFRIQKSTQSAFAARSLRKMLCSLKMAGSVKQFTSQHFTPSSDYLTNFFHKLLKWQKGVMITWTCFGHKHHCGCSVYCTILLVGTLANKYSITRHFWHFAFGSCATNCHLCCRIFFATGCVVRLWASCKYL